MIGDQIDEYRSESARRGGSRATLTLMSSCTALNASMRRCNRIPVWISLGNETERCLADEVAEEPHRRGTAGFPKPPVRRPTARNAPEIHAPDRRRRHVACEIVVEAFRVGRFDGALFVDRSFSKRLEMPQFLGA
jgi:hypothetical protein